MGEHKSSIKHAVTEKGTRLERFRAVPEELRKNKSMKISRSPSDRASHQAYPKANFLASRKICLMSSRVGATMTASGSLISLKEPAATPSAISCCSMGSRKAAWNGEEAPRSGPAGTAAGAARTHRFTRSRLGAGHEVPAGADDRDAVLLHRRRLGVAGLADAFSERLAQSGLIKRLRKEAIPRLGQRTASWVRRTVPLRLRT